MDFDLSMEQRMVADSVAGSLDRLAGDGSSPAAAMPVLAEFAALGLFDADTPLDRVAAVAAAIEIGRRLPAAPLTDMIAARLSFAADTLPIAEMAQNGRPLGVAAAGSVELRDGKAHGRLLVPFAGDGTAVLARPDGGANEAWLLIDLPGDRLSPADPIDQATPASWASLEGAAARPLTSADRRGFNDDLTLLAAAETLGAAQACFETTVEYVKDRRQFGRQVGSYQAIKHMAADGALALEAMRAAVEYAAWCADAMADNPAECAAALLTARSFVGDRAKQLAERCIQMHGGIAFTWEYGLHRFLRRILWRRNTVLMPCEARTALAGMIGSDPAILENAELVAR